MLTAVRTLTIIVWAALFVAGVSVIADREEMPPGAMIWLLMFAAGIATVLILPLLLWVRALHLREMERLLTIHNVDKMSGLRFEEYVATLMKDRGYKVRLNRGGSDFGVDLIAERGDEKIAIQTKRYSRPVPRAAVSDVVAGQRHFGCNKGMVVTNSVFSKSAQDFAKSSKCVLVDRMGLSEWIRNFQKERKT